MKDHIKLWKKIIKKDDFSTKHTDYFCDIRSLVSGYNYYFYCLSIKMVVFLIEIELIPFFFVFLYPNYASMTGQEIVKRPIERNGRVTEDFFVKCEPLFCSIMNIVFNHEVEYDELVNKLYIRREELQEEIVENAYDVWAEARKKEG